VEAVQQGLNVLFTHGTLDPIVPRDVADASVERLRKLVPQGVVRFESFAEQDHFPFKDISDRESALAKVMLEGIESRLDLDAKPALVGDPAPSPEADPGAGEPVHCTSAAALANAHGKYAASVECAAP